MNLAELEEKARAATPGPWILATSNSWRRFTTRDGKSVCEPTVYSRDDPHPDLHFRNGGQDGPDAAYIAALSPDVALKLIAVVRAAQVYFDCDDVNSFSRPRADAHEALRTALAPFAGEQTP